MDDGDIAVLVVVGVVALGIAAASKRAAWWVPSIPVGLTMVVAAVVTVSWEPEERQPWEEAPFLEGLEVVLWIILAVWLVLAVCLGWAVRLLRLGRPKQAAVLAAAGAAPFAAMSLWGSL